MAQLNFPARADGSSPSPGNPPVSTTHEDAGITWTWNNALGVWSTAENSGFTQQVADGRYLRLDASAGDQTRLAGQVRFDAATEHAAGLTTATITARTGASTYTTVGTTSSNASNHRFRTNNTAIVPSSGLIDASVTLTGTQTNSSNDTFPCGIRSSVITDASFDDTNSSFICGFQSRLAATSGAVGGEYVHYYAPSKRSSALAVGTIRAFHSGINNSDATDAFSFYGAGTAPAAFRGKILCGLQTNYTALQHSLNPNGGGIFISSTSNQASNNKFELYSNWRESGSNRAITFTGATSASDPSAVGRGYFNINQTGVTTSGITIGVRSDPRELTLTPIQNATSLIKRLSPGVEGFLAPNLRSVLPHAVIGEENETLEVGTYTDAEGTVRHNQERPEVIPYGATWKKTGTEDVMQQADLISLVPLLTKALQELETRIAALEGA